VSRKTGLFAAKLKELRTQANLTQSELAKRSGVPLGTLQGFEQGHREPTYGTLLKLARGLGVGLSAFETQEPTPEVPKRWGRKT
jgi:transcriptional regulator with XRE-family HTH domain